MAGPPKNLCELVGLKDACVAFVQPSGSTQSSKHIKPMHWYVACRLVIEGGFLPSNLSPRPPLRAERRGKALYLHYDPSSATGSEATVLGGLKTKDVDVVMALEGIGPCVAISMKGTLNAFRNLTNRLEEAIGDCTNLHMAYPTLIYGFLHLMRANREGKVPPSGLVVVNKKGETLLTPDESGNVKAADVAIRKDGKVTNSIVTFHDAIARLAGRKDLRNEFSRYEAITLLLVDPDEGFVGDVVGHFPLPTGVLHFDNFFATIYTHYDIRFVYSAPSLIGKTRRHFWHPDSPAFSHAAIKDFNARLGETDEEPALEDDAQSESS